MKIHDHFGKLRQVCNGIGDNLLKTIVIPMTGNKKNVELQGKEVWLEDFLNELADPAAPLIFEQVHFFRVVPFDSEMISICNLTSEPSVQKVSMSTISTTYVYCAYTAYKSPKNYLEFMHSI